MSHFTTVKTRLSNLDVLKKALERMGLSYQDGSHTITQYGRSEKAEVKLDDAVGLQLQKDGTYSMVGDFYHSRNSKLRKYYGDNGKFAADITTAYSIEEARMTLEEQQFFCSDNEAGVVGADGLIRMVYTQY